MVKGGHQSHSIGYTKTFSPAVKSSTIKVILSLAVLNGWEIRQIDINNAFLNGHLSEVVYMRQPAGFVDPQRPTHVCKLHKALYWLKQALRAWFDRLKLALTQQWGFSNFKSVTSLFFKRVDAQILFLLLYVDDIIVISSSVSLITQVISDLQSTFTLKDFGELNYLLGIQVTKIQLVYFFLGQNILLIYSLKLTCKTTPLFYSYGFRGLLNKSLWLASLRYYFIHKYN